MSNLFEDTPTKELSWLLNQIHEREIALPEFQRDFVWEPGATQELIVSIARNYPAGSLLAIRNTNSYFAAREIEGAPPLNGGKPAYLVLDGQQRLTSLYQAFYGMGEFRYFIRLGPLIQGADIEDDGVIFHIRASAQRGGPAKALKRYANIDGQAEDLVLPLGVLFGSKDGFLGWRDAVTERVEEREARLALGHDLLGVRKRYLTDIESYRFPVVLLSDKTPVDAVCTIFETLNRTGVKLSVFDLLAARFWAEQVKIRDMWDEALSEHPILGDFGIDPYYILQVIALLRKEAAPSCKRRDVLELRSTQVSKDWVRAVSGIADAIAILQDHCGVLNPKWLPYNAIVIPFAALLVDHPARGIQAGEIRRKLICWFWCSVFGQKYESGQNSQTERDFVEVGAWLDGGPAPSSVVTFSYEPEGLYEVTVKQRAIYRGVIALILSRNPLDFHEARRMGRAVIDAGEVDDHHVFPNAYLLERGIKDAKRRDCILNRTLIDRATSQSLNRRNPQDYFVEMRARLGEAAFTRLLDSHLLPSGGGSPLLANDFEAFLAWRRERIGEVIREATAHA